MLGEPRPRELVRHLEGYTALADLAVGDTVAVHWGWVATRLSPTQAATLERQTVHHLALANRTL